MSGQAIGTIVNRVCPECRLPLVVGDVWSDAAFAYRQMLVCPSCSWQGDEGGYWEHEGYHEPLPEDVRLRLGPGRGHRRAPMLPLEVGA